MNWKERLANSKRESQAETPKERYDHEANLGKYPNLVLNLRLKRNTQHRSIEQIEFPTCLIVDDIIRVEFERHRIAARSLSPARTVQQTRPKAF